MSAFRMAVRWIRDRAFPLRDAAGRVILSADVAEEVTERRQPEMQLCLAFDAASRRPNRGRGGGRYVLLGVLSVVLCFVQQSGAHIVVHSFPGIGTTFKIYLPAVGVLATRTLQSPDKPVRGSETWRIWQGQRDRSGNALSPASDGASPYHHSTRGR